MTTINTLVAPEVTAIKRKAKDYQNADFPPRWCPGCGSYAVLSALSKTFADLELAPENVAIISGIGCSSRLPYYTSVYGFHTIHGRAPTVAMGLKMTRPDLSVWIVTGDGDALSIGGNHFIHLMRRNPDLKMILFNNEIYGLTKGQASPTSREGQRTSTTPSGSIDNSMRPLSMAIAAGATFVARSVDTDVALTSEILTAAARHKGVAFIEVLQNCLIFNDGCFEEVSDKKQRPDTTLRLQAGEPMVFGAERNRGIRANAMRLEVVDGVTEATQSELLVHAPGAAGSEVAYALSQMDGHGFPTPLGILRQVEAETYEERMQAKRKPLVLEDVLKGASSWKVE
jgi:2-oxoglutarate/2-oxoacid ferredoxin oxidoreductase subunit beta